MAPGQPTATQEVTTGPKRRQDQVPRQDPCRPFGARNHTVEWTMSGLLATCLLSGKYAGPPRSHAGAWECRLWRPAPANLVRRREAAERPGGYSLAELGN